MFKKLKESIYVKAAAVFIVCGAVLLLFNSWLSKNQISLGFETLNSTLAPVYIGIILAFIICPVYNACVRYFYRRMLKSSKTKGFSIGATIVHDESKPIELSKDDKRGILTAARAAATIISVILVVGAVSLLIYFVVPQLVQSVIGLINTLPDRLIMLSAWVETHLAHFPVIVKWVDNIANAGTGDIIRWVQEHILNGNAMNIATMVSNGVVTAVKYVTNTVIGILIMIYLLNYKERLFAICRKLIAATCGQKRQNALYEFADIVNETFIGFIVGRIMDSLIIGLLTYIILAIVQMPFALMISVVVGVTNIIPFFGPFIGAVPSVILLMLEEPRMALYFIIIILVIQQIDGNIIGPKIVGNAIGISSFWVLLAVLIGGGLFGFMGMAFGVPVFAVIYRYLDKLTIQRLRYREKATDTWDYFSLEQYGIDDDEVSLQPPEKEKKDSKDSIKQLIEKIKDISGDGHERKAEGSAMTAEDNEELREALKKEIPSGEARKKAPKISTRDK